MHVQIINGSMRHSNVSMLKANLYNTKLTELENESMVYSSVGQWSRDCLRQANAAGD